MMGIMLAMGAQLWPKLIDITPQTFEFFDRDEMARFTHPDRLDATVAVYRKVLPKHHPRNNNPYGPTTVYAILRADLDGELRPIGEDVKTLPLAKLKAKGLHQALVAKPRERITWLGL